MYIVLIGYERHSAWNTKKEAIKQKAVLEDHGWGRNIFIIFDETVSCKNGHYYV